MALLRSSVLLAGLLFLWGCGGETREYEVRENTRNEGQQESLAEGSHKHLKSNTDDYKKDAHDHEGHVHRPFDFDLPAGWKEKSSSSGMRFFSFSDGTGKLDGSLVILGKQASDLPSNINRWREQIGLEKLSDEDCLKSLGEGMSKIGNFKSLHIKGPEGQGILAGIFLLKDRVLFAKMMGPSAQTSVEEGRFITFCTSLRPHTH